MEADPELLLPLTPNLPFTAAGALPPSLFTLLPPEWI